MYLLFVAPIARGILAETLTYFSGEDVPLGAIVTIPLRGKTQPGIVLGTELLAGQKSAVKEYPFAIKKIESVKSTGFFTRDFMETAQELADYTASNIGAVLSALVPKAILTQENDSFLIHKKNTLSKKIFHQLKWEGPWVFGGNEDERAVFYKNQIRESFARKESVFLFFPTLLDAEGFTTRLEAGMKPFAFFFGGKTTEKETRVRWKKALSEEHPVLIYGTGNFLSLPREDIGTIIIDKENSPLYKTIARPYLDLRTASLFFARRKKVTFIVGDSLLRTESVFEKESGRCHPRSHIPYTLSRTTRTTIVDRRKAQGVKPYKILSPEGKSLIEEAIKNKKRAFVYVHRRGFATETVCDDCGSTLFCKRCSTPLVFYKGNIAKENSFLCHMCRRRYEAEVRCSECGGWRMSPLGIGIDRTEEELTKEFPHIPLFKISYEHELKKGNSATYKHFTKEQPAILLGGESALPYFTERVPYVLITSVDSLFAIPEFRIRERVMRLLARIRERTERKLLIQTRNPGWNLFSYLVEGNVTDFYREEVAARQELVYPPFSTIIKIVREGSDESAAYEDITALGKKLRRLEQEIYPAFTYKRKGKFRLILLLKLPRGYWPDEALISTLRSLSHSFSVDVDPENLL